MWKRINSFVTVEPLLILYFFGEQLLSTGLQALMYNKYCVRDYGNLTDCSNSTWQEEHTDIQRKTSLWAICNNLVNILPMMVSAMMLGGYSQGRGLAMPMRLPLLFGVLNIAWIAVLAWYIHIAPELAFIGSFVSGLGGSFAAVLMASIAYVIRDSTDENRAIRITIAESCIGVGLTVGAFSAGAIIDALGLFWLFVIAASCELLALIDAFVRIRPNALEKGDIDLDLPLSRQKRRTAILSFESVRTFWTVVTKPRDRGRRLDLHLSVLAFVITYASGIGTTDIIYLYLVKENGFTNTQYSVYQGVCYGITVTGTMFFIYLYTKKLHLHILTVAVIGIANSSFCVLLLMMAHKQWLFWLTAIFRPQAALNTVALRTFISRCGDLSEQGAIMSYVATMQNIFSLLASVMFNGLYAETVALWPGTALALAVFLGALTIPILTYVRNRQVPLRLPENNQIITDQK